MKALITGASGFIGSHLIEELNRLGFDVHALMRKTSNSANLNGAKFTRVEGSLQDEDSLARAVSGVDYVFHLAGTISAKSRDEYFSNNAGGTERLARAVRKKAPTLTRFVYVSSLAAGGPSRDGKPRRETDPDRPVSAYGESKLQGEKELLQFRGKFPISIIRPPIVYGPRDKGVFTFVQIVARNLMPILRGATPDKKKHYSAVHVHDLCRGIAQAGLARPDGVASGEVFYLAGDGTFTYEEMLRTIADQLEREPLRFHVPGFALHAAALGMTAFSKIAGKPVPLNWDKLQELLPDYWTCSNDKAKQMLGFRPEYDLAAGMAHAIEWYKKEKWI